MKSVILEYNFICSFLWLMICTIFKFLSKKKLNIIRGTVICILWWQVSAKILGLYKYKIHIGNCYYCSGVVGKVEWCCPMPKYYLPQWVDHLVSYPLQYNSCSILIFILIFCLVRILLRFWANLRIVSKKMSQRMDSFSLILRDAQIRFKRRRCLLKRIQYLGICRSRTKLYTGTKRKFDICILVPQTKSTS